MLAGPRAAGRRRRTLGIALGMLLAAGFPLIVVRELFVLQILTFVFIFAIYAQSWNLAAHSGQFSLGHATFLGLGAYASVLAAGRAGLPAAAAMFMGPVVPALVGLGMARLCLRLREWYFGMVTFGFTAIVQVLVVEQLGGLTNRWDGLDAERLWPAGLSVEQAAVLNYLAALALMVATYLVAAAMMYSRSGLAFAAIHDNELVATVSGVNVRRYRLAAMLLSGYLAGLAGALNSHTLTRHISPGIFGVEDSIWPLLYTVAGGLRTPEGPILGTLVVRVFWEWALRRLGGFESLILIGLALALVVTFFPRGLYDLLARVTTRLAGPAPGARRENMR
ncbi:MAG TPA: branched-chain amino acid ABC transporter permease [Methylomirabilota bacterium]|nr:branched-chain amino acid ABC transporter permease [Methylomirabilota bacterium]